MVDWGQVRREVEEGKRCPTCFGRVRSHRPVMNQSVPINKPERYCQDKWHDA